MLGSVVGRVIGPGAAMVVVVGGTVVDVVLVDVVVVDIVVVEGAAVVVGPDAASRVHDRVTTSNATATRRAGFSDLTPPLSAHPSPWRKGPKPQVGNLCGRMSA